MRRTKVPADLKPAGHLRLGDAGTTQFADLDRIIPAVIGRPSFRSTAPEPSSRTCIAIAQTRGAAYSRRARFCWQHLVIVG